MLITASLDVRQMLQRKLVSCYLFSIIFTRCLQVSMNNKE